MPTTIAEASAAIRTMPPRRMAEVRTVGDPSVVGARALGTLYGAVYSLRHALSAAGRDFDVGSVCAIWPNAHEAPREEWIGVWGLEVPDDVEELDYAGADEPIALETWLGGRYAEILHVGPLDAVSTTIEQLRRFVEESGYEIAGPHEEEYLTRPGAEEQRTRIRYPVTPVG